MFREIDVPDSDLGGHDRENGALGGISEVNENTPQRTPCGVMNLKRVSELSIGDDPGSHEQLAESLSRFRHYCIPLLRCEGASHTRAPLRDGIIVRQPDGNGTHGRWDHRGVACLRSSKSTRAIFWKRS